MSSRIGRILKVAALLWTTTGSIAGSDDRPFVAAPLTRPGEFTRGIEGPGCDGEGNVYAVNFGKEGTIGKVNPGTGRGDVFVTLPGKSVGNGIVFDRRGRMYVADYVGHNVLRVDMKTGKVEVFAHAAMNQPNDLAVAPDDTLYASDPDWANSKGQVWKVTTAGEITRVAADMGTTNGIEVSPDGKWLYVNESVQRNVWKFPIGPDGSLGEKQLIRRFPDFGFDGMRCDVKGNLYICRHGKGTVVVMTPEGQILHEVDVLGKMPTNVCFGGPDGKTVYVTEVEHTRLVRFRALEPGLAWQRWRNPK
jgi:gluconolactonase